MDTTRSRRWLLTINNPKSYDLGHDNIKSKLSTLNLKYWCMSDEIGDEGTYHTHLFIWCNNATRFNGIKKLFPEAHIDYCYGTAQEVHDYVTKQGHDEKAHTKVEGTFEESGVFDDSFKGTLSESISKVISGEFSVLEAVVDNSKLITQVQNLEKLKALADYEKYSRLIRDVEVIYKYGQPGTGKSSSTYDENQDLADVYVVQDYEHPFDSYNGQSVVVFEEYRSNFTLTNMLQYLDRYPVQLPARYNNRMAQFTKVYVISNLTLGEQYSQVDEASKQAFIRRFNRVEYFYDDRIEKAKIMYDNGHYTIDWQNKETTVNTYSTYYRNLVCTYYKNLKV